MRSALSMLIVCVVLGLSANAFGAVVVYDDFSSPATGTPDAAKWISEGTVSNSGGVATVSGNSAMGKLDKDLSFGQYRYTIADPGSGPRIFGLIDHSGTAITGFIENGIVIRNDTGNNNDLILYKDNVEVEATPIGYFGGAAAGDEILFDWSSDSLTVSVNGSSVYNTTDTSKIPTVDLRYSFQVYSGGTIGIDEVAVVPEPASLMLGAVGGLLVFLRRNRRAG